eukprot:15434977-Alexandrium_andersonii.AAC.1
MLRPFLGLRSSSFEHLKQFRIFQDRRAPGSFRKLQTVWVWSVDSTYSSRSPLGFSTKQVRIPGFR